MTAAKRKPAPPPPRKGGRAPTRAERKAAGGVCVEVWLDEADQIALAQVEGATDATGATALRRALHAHAHSIVRLAERRAK